MARKRMESRTYLGNVLYEARRAAGMTAVQMGEHCRLKSHTQISRWEAGLDKPGLLHLLRIGAVATGQARETIIDACREMALQPPKVDQVKGILREVANGG